MKRYGYTIRTVLLSSIILLLISCAVQPPKNSNTEATIDQALQSSIQTNQAINQRQQNKPVPAFLNQALAPDVPTRISVASKAPAHRFNIAVNDVPAKDFFMGLVKDTKGAATKPVTARVAAIISAGCNCSPDCSQGVSGECL